MLQLERKTDNAVVGAYALLTIASPVGIEDFAKQLADPHLVVDYQNLRHVGYSCLYSGRSGLGQFNGDGRTMWVEVFDADAGLMLVDDLLDDG